MKKVKIWICKSQDRINHQRKLKRKEGGNLNHIIYNSSKNKRNWQKNKWKKENKNFKRLRMRKK
jgi:hypothetical protein